MQMVRSLLEADFHVYMLHACLQTKYSRLTLAKGSSMHSFNDSGQPCFRRESKEIILSPTGTAGGKKEEKMN